MFDNSDVAASWRGSDSPAHAGWGRAANLSRPDAFQARRFDTERVGDEGGSEPHRLVRHAPPRESFSAHFGQAAYCCGIIACRVRSTPCERAAPAELWAS